MLHFSSSPPVSEICPLRACFSTGPFVLFVSDALESDEAVPAVLLCLSLAVLEILAFWSPERREIDLRVRRWFLRWCLIAPRILFYLMRAFCRNLDLPDRPSRCGDISNSSTCSSSPCAFLPFLGAIPYPPALGLFLLPLPILVCQLLAILRSGDHCCSITMCALADALRLQSVCSQLYVSLCIVGGCLVFGRISGSLVVVLVWLVSA